jgi:NADH-quinone oxidoreductase subunit E
MLPDPLRQELQAHIASAVTPREAAVGTMKRLQAHYGWLSDEAVEEAGELLGLSPLQVEELATFYEMLYRRPVGKKVIHCCDSISCWVMGGETLLQHIAGLLEISVGQTTSDGVFTLLPCCCLGNCGQAPTMMINDTLYGDLTPQRAAEILQKERQQR